MNELQVKVDQVPGQINFNYDEIRENLSRMMNLYKDAVVTEENKAASKKEVASLRRIKKAIDDSRKEVKQECLKPYQEFEAKAVALMSLVDEPILLIDKQVKEFDEKQRAEKCQKIREMYDEVIGDLAEYLPFERAYDHKWETTSVSLKKAKEELQAVINSTQMAVGTISAMQSDATQEALDIYKRTLDMAAAIHHINDYERRKAEILLREEQKRREEEERKRQAEIDRARTEERRRVAEEERIREEERKKLRAEQEREATREAAEGFFSPEPEPDVEETDGFWQYFDDDRPKGFNIEPKVTAIYRVVATEDELEQVEMAFNSIGIEFERRDA